MTDTDNTSSTHGLVSKCVAIQYGLLVAGTVLLLIATWHWYQSWCSGPVAVPVYQAAVMPATASHFAAKPSIVRPLNGRISDKTLQENFLSYRPEENSQDFKTYGSEDP